ncbi:MAG: hypothetical protein AB7G12_15180 [Thermoanaerobaculia bacterium]
MRCHPIERPRLFVSLLLASLLRTAALTAIEPPAIPTSACLTDGQVEDLLLHDGVLYLAGRFLKVRPPGTDPGDPGEVDRRWFAACDAASGAVLAWDPQIDCLGGGGGCTNARGQSVVSAPGGTHLFLAGKFDTVGATPRKNAARVAIATAALDPAFAPEPNDRVQRIVVAPDESRVYLGGNFTRAGGCTPAPCHAYLAAVDPATGVAVAAFDPAITTADASFRTVYSIAFSEEGDVLYFGGQFDTVNGEPRSSIAAVDPATGTTTLLFAPRLSDSNPSDPYVQVHDIRVDHDWVYACGDWWETSDWGGMQDQRNVNRFHPLTGIVDESFWIATDGGVQACDLDPGLGVLFVGGHFDCVRAYLGRDNPVDHDPAQCGTDPLFLGTLQRDMFALRLRDGGLVDWNPDTSGIGGTWAMSTSLGRLDLGGELGWPRTGTATHANLLTFALPLFADDFESGDRSRWSTTVP